MATKNTSNSKQRRPKPFIAKGGLKKNRYDKGGKLKKGKV